MNDEIRETKIGMYSTDEILEFMTNGEGRGFMGRSMYDALLDYITKLQEENLKLSKDCDMWNTKYNEEFDSHIKDKAYYFNLYEDYKSRVEKAVEYINKYEVCLIKNGIPEISRTHLLNILQNGSENK